MRHIREFNHETKLYLFLQCIFALGRMESESFNAEAPDNAYQGFASGKLDEDAYSLRYFAGHTDRLCVF